MEKKKPGRKKKNESSNITTNSTTNSTTTTTHNDTSNPPTVCKKRGRKPKGGKIITDVNINTSPKPLQQNIILHLKCSLDDINNVYNINELPQGLPNKYSLNRNH